MTEESSARVQEQLLRVLDDIDRLLAQVRELVIDGDPEMMRKANGD